MNTDQLFESYLERWKLIPDGGRLVTSSSCLQPVLWGNEKAMLKIATVQEEKLGARLMSWWDGQGAARVFQQDEEAILLERATGSQSLALMVEQGDDDRASLIICDTLGQLHSPRAVLIDHLVPLIEWFQPLLVSASTGMLQRCAGVAFDLLADQAPAIALHGDIHHGNILDFDERGWLAIDPKGLRGDRAFDYANLFCNPSHAIAISPGRLARQAHQVAESTGLDRERLLHWIVAWAGLSALWFTEDGDHERSASRLQVAHIAAGLIGRH